MLCVFPLFNFFPLKLLLIKCGMASKASVVYDFRADEEISNSIENFSLHEKLEVDG